MSTQTVVMRFRAARLQQRVVERFAAATDLKKAESEASKSKHRWDENKRLFQSLKGADRAEYGRGIQKMIANGNKAEAAINLLAKEYAGADRSLRGQARQEMNATLKMFDIAVQQWNNWGPNDPAPLSRDPADRLANIYGYAQQMESYIRYLPDALQGKDTTVDDSWRSH